MNQPSGKLDAQRVTDPGARRTAESQAAAIRALQAKITELERRVLALESK